MDFKSQNVQIRIINHILGLSATFVSHFFSFQLLAKLQCQNIFFCFFSHLKKLETYEINDKLILCFNDETK